MDAESKDRIHAGNDVELLNEAIMFYTSVFITSPSVDHAGMVAALCSKKAGHVAFFHPSAKFISGVCRQRISFIVSFHSGLLAKSRFLQSNKV